MSLFKNITPHAFSSGASGGSSTDCNLGLTIVRLTLLSAPKTFGIGTDGRIHVAYVGSRR